MHDFVNDGHCTKRHFDTFNEFNKKIQKNKTTEYNNKFNIKTNNPVRHDKRKFWEVYDELQDLKVRKPYMKHHYENSTVASIAKMNQN